MLFCFYFWIYKNFYDSVMAYLDNLQDETKYFYLFRFDFGVILTKLGFIFKLSCSKV